jgi:CDP-glycerol glycerophosphotransferase (TagB/SpsB family)
MKRVFISADHGLAVVYFLQSDVVPTLLDAGVEVVLLTDDSLRDHITHRFGRPGLTVESLRFREARRYFQSEQPSVQYWLDFLRRAGGSTRINLGAVDAYREQVRYESTGLRRRIFPLMEGALAVVRRSQAARQALIRWQSRFVPNLYTDLFEKYQPDMTIAATPGWRFDRYLLRESAARGIPNTAVIVGWDNPSSYNVPGAKMDYATCWSQLQKDELVLGSDWDPSRVYIGGIPSYDGYFQKKWLMPREEYFQLHGLDPNRKLIAYAASFITFSPNIQNIEALARLVAEDRLSEPAQLLVRLHPNHFMDVDRFAAERERVRAFVREYPHVHLIEPVPLGGELGYYSGEDMDEKSSMMAHADVFTTVYSTMVVEAACHGTPVVAVTLDHEQGWTDKFYLPLTEIGHWPTHERFIQARAGLAATTQDELQAALDHYLSNPQAEAPERQQFLKDEVTFLDGSAGRRTGKHLLSILESR